MFWSALPLAAVTGRIEFVAAFLLSGMVGTAGHYLFGDGTVDRREATSSTQAVYYSSRMALLFVAGAYGRRIAEAERRWRRYRNGEIDSLIDPVEIERKLGREVWA